MNEPIILTTKSYPELVRDFAGQNFNLKVLCGALIGLTFLMLILVLVLIKQGPSVIALDGGGEISHVETRITDLQIQAAAREYISYRYNWTKEDISERLRKAGFFVSPALVSAFRKSMVDVQKFVAEKKVRQRVYPKSIDVDTKERKIKIVADRITEFDGLKAATEMRLELNFEINDRSVVNPWGVFITKESEGGSK